MWSATMDTSFWERTSLRSSYVRYTIFVLVSYPRSRLVHSKLDMNRHVLSCHPKWRWFDRSMPRGKDAYTSAIDTEIPSPHPSLDTCQWGSFPLSLLRKESVPIKSLTLSIFDRSRKASTKDSNAETWLSISVHGAHVEAHSATPWTSSTCE